ncbi:uncharacterized protein A1O5_04688 [Cladophialophora psammophila CBS 110553]|uniref:Uncharacterized protein n=1 Tax=Cladophialophora psammophila CBS 110553 TaxID=1182543 RepID=W9XPB3_9EURO|nr:uncharacterized protein A1O5_04688 [Cladophialophora psammophila CBS 110553]EXJ72184.1 hypothetical protein A1O5_04688 [Cladophialophora psammophila CBS 110553]
MSTIDLVINNAGTMWFPEHTLTPDGVELTLAPHHGARTDTQVSPPPFSDLAWTKPASAILENECPSFAMMKAAGIELHGELVNESMSYVPTAAYVHGKTANLLYSVDLNQRLYDQLESLSLAVRLGEVTTEFGRNFSDQA